ncbi:MAG: tol-pal system protein YbgF [Succinivibrio sp.]
MKLTLKSAVIAASLMTFAANADDAQMQAMQRSLLNMQNEISSLQDELASSQGQIEDLNHQIEMLKNENTELKSKLAASANTAEASDAADKTGAAEEGAKEKVEFVKTSGSGNVVAYKQSSDNKPAAEVQSENAEVKKSVESAEKTPEQKAADDLYKKSYDLMMKNDFVSAQTGFTEYVSKYPDSTLTPNAWYWLGQIQFRQKNYQEARVSFLNTAKFKDTPKRADALYKLGVTSKALGDKAKAKRFFDLLIKSYPNSVSSTLAKKELQSL